MYESLLHNIAYHIKLDQKETDCFLSLVQQKIIKKNNVFLQSGEICRSMAFVNTGCLRIFNMDEEGREHNVTFFPEDWWALDVASFHSKKPAFYTIDALEDTEVFLLSFADMQKLFDEVPKFERFFRILAQNGFILYEERITSSLALPAEERYELFTKLYPKLEQRIAQKHIASYLGITPVFLSMLRRRR
jgi:CRP-like cAMP-binding protein